TAAIAKGGEHEQCNQPVDRLPGCETADDVVGHDGDVSARFGMMAAKRVCSINTVILPLTTDTGRSMRPRPRRCMAARKRSREREGTGSVQATMSHVSGCLYSASARWMNTCARLMPAFSSNSVVL